MTFNKYSLWQSVTWDHPPDGGYGGYSEIEYKLYFYLLLHEQITEKEPAGKSAKKILSRLENSHRNSVRLKYPKEGAENKFRDDVFSKIEAEVDIGLSDAPIVLVILPKLLDNFHTDVHRFAAVDLSKFINESGQFNSIGFGQTVTSFSKVLSKKEDFFSALSALEKLKIRGSQKAWSRIVKAEVGVGFLIVDLKEVVKLLLRNSE